MIDEEAEFLGFNIYYPGIRDELDIEGLIAWRIRRADEENEWPRENLTKKEKRKWVEEIYLRELAAALDSVLEQIRTHLKNLD
ncbi:MAG: hypothetical protein HWN71_04790 [Desulfobacterales bacterium]|nr:hypothetical protein [Desulfobacterales bacterium]